MSTFIEAHQARTSLKMKLSNYSWYTSSAVLPDESGYSVVITVSKLDNGVKKVIPPVVNGVSIRTELE